MANKRASEAAKAVNDIMRLDAADQGPLMDVLTSYFCHDPARHLNDDDDFDSDEDEDAAHGSVQNEPSPVDEGAQYL